jgi:hypothetical protein
MFVRIHAGLLALTLAQAPAVLAEDMIRVSVEEGKKRTEFRLNGNLECVLENQRITCVPVSQ